MTTAEMDNLVKVRMGEALEEELRKDTNFQQRQKEWRDAAREFDSMVSLNRYLMLLTVRPVQKLSFWRMR